MKRPTTISLAIGLALLASTGTRAAVSQDDFHVETTANLVSLCNADAADPLYTAARNFCHGFAVGTYRAVVTEMAASRARHKMFCVPDPAPSRDQAIAAFVNWASGRPKTLGSTPTDGIVEYMATQYPCK
jgi:hypothetical protein